MDEGWIQPLFVPQTQQLYLIVVDIKYLYLHIYIYIPVLMNLWSTQG